MEDREQGLLALVAARESLETGGGTLSAAERCQFALGLLDAERLQAAQQEVTLAIDAARKEGDAESEALGVEALERCHENRPAALPSLEGKHALVVEDDVEVRGLLAAFLRHLGLTVSEAIDGHDAFERLEELRTADLTPDLVVCDVSMPRCTGPELYERLRASDTKLPFLFVSGCQGSYLDDLPLADDGVDFLEKPIGIDELGARLRALLAQSRATAL